VLKERSALRERYVSFIERAFRIGDHELITQRNAIEAVFEDLGNAQYPIDFTETLATLGNGTGPNGQMRNTEFLKAILDILPQLAQEDATLSITPLRDILWGGIGRNNRRKVLQGIDWTGLRDRFTGLDHRDCYSALLAIIKAEVLLPRPQEIRPYIYYVCNLDHPLF